ncbi:MAG: CoA pyrophosphatase [Rhodospirillales bacterium]|nr:CoA pyrophosphatase [Rhodospirillales bacterium]
MNKSLTRDMIVARLAQRTEAPESARGDYDLNPELVPSGGPLTPAAVLVPLVDRAEGMTVLFTQRTDHLEHHPGQISFPGGHVEEADGAPEAAALRETEEETGIAPHFVNVIGRLDEYVTRTGFSVIPVVGVLTPDFSLDPDPFEVSEVFEVPLDFFLDAANHQRHCRVLNGKDRHFYAMPYGDYFIWGATAGMLKNLYDCLVRP